MVKIGTSGYSYDDWVGPFYPAGMGKAQFLAFYAKRFSTVEINMTYYRLPDRSLVASWARRTPKEFTFVLKANRMMTHERDDPETESTFNDFREAVKPLEDAGKFGCVLAQFPNSFRPSDANRDYLTVLRDRLPDMPLVCEFRHSAWVAEESFDLLRGLNMGYCCVDEPRLDGLMPPITTATSSIGYVRFHGRNASKWYHHEQAYERYDYAYEESELHEWVGKVEELDKSVEKTYVFFNNHYGAKAIASADMFASLLAEAGLNIGGPNAQPHDLLL